MVYYEIESVEGDKTISYEGHFELQKALKTRKMTVWRGGIFGICDDWGRKREKNVKRITRLDKDGVRTIIYERETNKK